MHLSIVKYKFGPTALVGNFIIIWQVLYDARPKAIYSAIYFVPVNQPPG